MLARPFRHIAVLVFLLIVGVSSLCAQQSDPMIYRSGEDGQSMLSNPDARAEYFYQRVTYPGREIPVGARVLAFREAQEHAPLFSPAGSASTQAAMEWKNVGPANVGGRIITVASNPKNPSAILIGTAGGGIWRTWDAGMHWHSISDELPTQAMGALAINPVDTSIVYAGTGEASYAQRTFDGGGMYKSSDGGSSWFEIGMSTLPPFSRASDLVVNPVNPDILFAAIPDGVRDPSLIGIYRSKDAGENWELVLTGRMSDVVLNPLNPDIVYTASSKVFGSGTADRYGMFKTTDGGDNWFPLDIGVPDSLMGRTSIGICDAQPDVLYIGVSNITGDDRTPLLGVYKTTDAGANWNKLEVPFDYMVSQGWYDNIMGVHPANPDIAYAGGVKLIVTTDGGDNWDRVRDQGYGGIVHVDQHAIEFNREDPSIVYLGNDGGFFVGTGNGAAWEKRDYGLSITQFIGGAMHPSSDAILFGGTQDNGTLFSQHAPDFSLALYGDGGNGAINPDYPNIMYTTKETLKFYRSDDFGETWTRMQSGLGMDRSLFYIDFAMDPNDPDVLYLGTSRLYKTTNGGKNWSLKNSCLIPAAGGCYYISALSVAPYDGNFVFAGGTGGGVSISTDAGETWASVADSLLPDGYCSSVHSFTPDVIYATYSPYGIDKIWRSGDAGTSWESINGDLPDIPVNDLIELDGKIIVASDLGVFVSDDEGVHWQRLGTGMPSLSVQRFTYSASTGTLRAYTHGRGMYDLPWSQLPASAPVITSLPDTSILEIGALFMYAPVVEASPPAGFRLLEAPAGATIDSVLGVVRWNGGAKQGRFTIEAANSEGSSTQQFTVATTDVQLVEWSIVQPHPLSTPVNVMAWGAPQSLWLGRDSAYVSYSPDGGQTWTHHTLPGTNAQVLDIHAFGNGSAVVGTRSGHIMKTDDGGENWTMLLAKVNARFGNLHFQDPDHGIAITEDADRTSTAFVYRTSDGGVNWEQIAQVPARFPLDNTLTFLDDERGWFASSNASLPSPSEPGILWTTDGGFTWTEAQVSAQNIAGVSFLDDRRGFCVDDITGFVRRSINGGVNWRSAFYPMSGRRNIDVHAFPGSDVVWIVNDDQAWVSADAGASWTSTKVVPIGSLRDAVFADSATGWIVSMAGIVEKLSANPLLSAYTPSSQPGAMRIAGVYPHPVTDGRAVVSIVLNSARKVTLDLYNSAGVLVSRIAEGAYPAGTRQMMFERQDLPNGVYFLALRSGTESVFRRMMITR
jgi:photosystem II stability/assembly factor-like uncharacterized protein